MNRLQFIIAHMVILEIIMKYNDLKEDITLVVDEFNKIPEETKETMRNASEFLDDNDNDDSAITFITDHLVRRIKVYLEYIIKNDVKEMYAVSSSPSAMKDILNTIIEHFSAEFDTSDPLLLIFLGIVSQKTHDNVFQNIKSNVSKNSQVEEMLNALSNLSSED